MKMETVKFEELGLYPQLLRAIKEMGFEEATPIPVSYTHLTLPTTPYV